MDQLVELGALDDLAGRGGDVAPDFKGGGIAVGHLPPRHVGQQVLQALEQVFAARLDDPLQHQRIGDGEVRRAHRVDEAAGEEA